MSTHAHSLDIEPANARSVLVGAASGAAGGAVASWVMNRFQDRFPPAAFAKLLGEAPPAGGAQPAGDDPPVKAAEAIFKGVLGHGMTPHEKSVAEPVMHYGVGVMVGAAYGAAAEISPAVTIGTGAGLGAAVWVGAYEAVVPALGLDPPPWKTPASMQLFGLALNLVYGVTTEVVRRGVRDLLT